MNLKILLNQCNELYKIKLENNKIDNLDKLKCLADYKITKINLEGNPLVQATTDYKKELFELIPSLSVIDGTDKKGAPVDSTIYGGEDDEEEEEDDEYPGDEGEEEEDISGEEFEGDEDDEEDEDDDENPKKKAKH